MTQSDEAATHLTRERKEQFFRDGFIVIKNAVPPEISQRAKELILASLPAHRGGRSEQLPTATWSGLVRGSRALPLDLDRGSVDA